jgi:hypothetical protein
MLNLVHRKKGKVMKKLASAVLFAFAMSSLPAFAASEGKPAPEKKLTRQQMKMKKCNADAKEKKLKGQERRNFMKSCLSGKS